MSRRQQGNKLWAEIDRIQKLLKLMETEAESLSLDITNDKLYTSLQAYIAGLRAGESLI
jgi:hypothetical protein